MTPHRPSVCRLCIALLLLAAGAGCGGSAEEGAAAAGSRDLGAPGPYPVGNTSFVLEDASRPHGCGAGNRRLVTEAWYPALDHGVPCEENRVSDFMLDQREAVEAELGSDELNDLLTGSCRDAPLAPSIGPMPLLVFSHGFSSNRFQNYTMSRHLASHGYLVVSADHTCNAKAAPLPDGPVFFTWLNAPFTLSQRIADVRFLVDVFTTDPPGMLAGWVDPTRVGLWGHSFGGLTVVEAVKEDRRVDAMLQLASFGLPDVPGDLDLATLFTWGEEDKWMHSFEAFHDQVIEAMPRPKYVLNFPDTGHFAFSDLCSFSVPLAENGDGCGEGTRIEGGAPFVNPDPDAMHAVLNPYAVAFFGEAFYDDPVCAAYLARNHFPDRVEYLPSR